MMYFWPENLKPCLWVNRREYILCSPGGIQTGKEDEDAFTFALVGEVTPMAHRVSTVSWWRSMDFMFCISHVIHGDGQVIDDHKRSYKAIQKYVWTKTWWRFMFWAVGEDEVGILSISFFFPVFHPSHTWLGAMTRAKAELTTERMFFGLVF